MRLDCRSAWGPFSTRRRRFMHNGEHDVDDKDGRETNHKRECVICIPCDRNVSVPLRPGLTSTVLLYIVTLPLSTLSLRRRFRCGLSSIVHVEPQTHRRIGKVPKLCNLVLKAVHFRSSLGDGERSNGEYDFEVWLWDLR